MKSYVFKDVKRRNENRYVYREFYIIPHIYNFQCPLFFSHGLALLHVFIFFQSKELHLLFIVRQDCQQQILSSLVKNVFTFFHFQKILLLDTFFFSILNVYCLLASTVVDEKLAINHIGVPLYVRSGFPLITSMSFTCL